MRIDVQSLEYFLTVSEKLSFTRAAEVLGVSQPRVSLIVKRMEDRLGFPLFRRVHGRVELTAEGASLVAEARSVIGVIEGFDRQLEEIRRKVTTRLRLGSPNYTAQIPDRVWLFDEFALRHPGVTIEFAIDTTPALVAAVESGDLDVAAVTGPFEQHGLESLFLVKSTALLAVPEESRLADLPVITPHDVRGVQIATYPSDVGRLLFERWYGPLRDAGAQLMASREAKGEAVLRFAARRRMPTTYQVWPGQNLPPASTAPGMVFKMIEGMDVTQELHLVRSPANANPPSNWLWQLARAAFREGRTPTTEGIALGRLA